MTIRYGLGAFAGLALAAGIAATPAGAEEFITIGTAGQTGLYYIVGQSVCAMVNRESDTHGLRCTAPATGGSIANLNGLRAGDLNFGIVQSDWQYHALHGTSTFEEAGPDPRLRSVFSAHPDVVTVVARADSGITDLQGLRGHRVNIGNPGSGSRATAEVLLDTIGIRTGDLAMAAALKSAEQSQALCDNNIDAMIFSAGHPVGNIQEATVACDTVFLQVDSPEIAQMVADTEYYSPATIPAGMYRGQPDDVRSYGPLATLVTSADTSDEAVYQVVRAVFENFDRFQALHPAFAHLQPEQMVSNGMIAPVHPGALRYYQERGWR